MPTLAEIETRAKALSDARAKLADIIAELNDGIEALKRSHMAKLKAAVTRAAERHDELRALIEDAPELFVKPKTVIFHGIRLGLMKGKGGIEWDDAERVIALIERHLPEQLDALCKVTRKPSKDALAGLDVATLKKLGCRVVETGEEIYIKPTDSAVNKLVDALLKDATEQGQ